MRRFKKIYIEITNSCNLSCDFCPKTARPAAFMSRELFEAVLNKIKGYTEYLYFHVMGEPLLHPGIGMFLDLCDLYEYKVNITTNGTLIGKAADSIISKPALRQVNFSLHSLEANRDGYSLDSYLSSIFEFIQRTGNGKKPLISLRLWNVSPDGKNKMNREILRRIEREFRLDFQIDDRLMPRNGINLAENVFLSQARKFDWPDTGKDEVGGKGFCYGLRDQAAVLVDGTVVPCCLDAEGTIRLGNINEQDFGEIIQGKRAQEIYKGFSRREAVEELCRKCGYRTRFDL